MGIANQRQNVLMTVRASSVHGMSSKKNGMIDLGGRVVIIDLKHAVVHAELRRVQKVIVLLSDEL